MRVWTEKEVRKYKIILKNIAQKAVASENPEYGKGVKNSQLFNRYATSSPIGQAVYRSFSDGELFELLRESAKRLGHSPAQKEIFWIYRSYIRKRFEKWPYALQKAGLSRSAGKSGTTVEVMMAKQKDYSFWLEKVKDSALELERPPHPIEMPEACEIFKEYFKTWADVLHAAGVDPNWLHKEVVYPIPDLEGEYQVLLKELKKTAMELGRSPLKIEIDSVIRTKLRERCGSWRNVLFQIGLEPVTKISPFSSSFLQEMDRIKSRSHKEILQDSLYKVLNLDEKGIKYLAYLKKKTEKLGRSPIKEELPEELVRSLLTSCGTWANTLHQIGRKPLRGEKLMEVKKAYRKRGMHK